MIFRYRRISFHIVAFIFFKIKENHPRRLNLVYFPKARGVSYAHPWGLRCTPLSHFEILDPSWPLMGLGTILDHGLGVSHRGVALADSFYVFLRKGFVLMLLNLVSLLPAPPRFRIFAANLRSLKLLLSRWCARHGCRRMKCMKNLKALKGTLLDFHLIRTAVMAPPSI